MATIKTTLAAGSVASPFTIGVSITKQLCLKTPNAPVFNPVFSLVSYRQIGTTTNGIQYEALVNVQGIVTYTPCGQCCAKSQTVNDQFVIPFFSETAVSTVTVSGGTAYNKLITSGGCDSCCSNTMQSNVPLTLTTTPSA